METTALFLNLAVAAVAAVLSARILRTRIKEGPAGAIGLATHLAVAYALGSARAPIAVALAAGLASAIAVAFVVRALVPPRA